LSLLSRLRATGVMTTYVLTLVSQVGGTQQPSVSL